MYSSTNKMLKICFHKKMWWSVWDCYFLLRSCIVSTSCWIVLVHVWCNFSSMRVSYRDKISIIQSIYLWGGNKQRKIPPPLLPGFAMPWLKLLHLSFCNKKTSWLGRKQFGTVFYKLQHLKSIIQLYFLVIDEYLFGFSCHISLTQLTPTTVCQLIQFIAVLRHPNHLHLWSSRHRGVMDMV